MDNSITGLQSLFCPYNLPIINNNSWSSNYPRQTSVPVSTLSLEEMSSPKLKLCMVLDAILAIAVYFYFLCKKKSKIFLTRKKIRDMFWSFKFPEKLQTPFSTKKQKKKENEIYYLLNCHHLSDVVGIFNLSTIASN